MTKDNHNASFESEKDSLAPTFIEKFLPASQPKRDVVMLFLWLLVIDAVALALVYFGWELSGVAILSLGNGNTLWHYYSRLTERMRNR